MKGYIFVSPGSDPGVGRRLDDPIFGKKLTTMGGCRPDLRRYVRPGDRLFVISGKVKGVSQYIIGGFAVDEKINALAAHARFPQMRLKHVDGEKVGNILVDSSGHHHELDHHPNKNFERRIENYIIGRDQVYIETPKEILLARERSLEILKNVFGKTRAMRISEIVRRNASLDEKQITKLLDALQEIKTEAASV